MLNRNIGCIEILRKGENFEDWYKLNRNIGCIEISNLNNKFYFYKC